MTGACLSCFVAAGERDSFSSCSDFEQYQCSEYEDCLGACGTCVDQMIILEECLFDQNTNGLAPCNFGDCGLSAPPPDPCVPDPCVNGLCSASGGQFMCDCFEGWTGSTCHEEKVGVTNPCDPDPCMNGACAAAGGDYSCSCLLGWTGVNCNVEPGEDPIDDCPTELNNVGDCVTSSGGSDGLVYLAAWAVIPIAAIGLFFWLRGKTQAGEVQAAKQVEGSGAGTGGLPPVREHEQGNFPPPVTVLIPRAPDYHDLDTTASSHFGDDPIYHSPHSQCMVHLFATPVRSAMLTLITSKTNPEVWWPCLLTSA